MTYYTVVLVALAYLRWATGGKSAIYPVLLWFVPLETSFMFFMFLRDVYQHSNADDGRLTNSRVFFTDPFTRWAVFVYGQDMHIPHHLFPAVPHYRLRNLHELLKWVHPDYRAEVVETHGTFHDDRGPSDDPRRDDPPANAARPWPRSGTVRELARERVEFVHRRPNNMPAARMARPQCWGRGSGRVRPSAGCQRRGNSTGIAAAGIAKNAIRMPLKSDETIRIKPPTPAPNDETRASNAGGTPGRSSGSVGRAATSRARATPASAWDWIALTSPAFAASTRAAACSAEIIAF